tara:strand:- start:468 stop:662 length:195 start_codon:yes stop_codon:yes gene_type:complete
MKSLYLNMTKLDMLSDVLHDFCVKQGLEFMSADDILFSDLDLTEYQKQWLRSYIETWDIIQEVS